MTRKKRSSEQMPINTENQTEQETQPVFFGRREVTQDSLISTYGPVSTEEITEGKNEKKLTKTKVYTAYQKTFMKYKNKADRKEIEKPHKGDFTFWNRLIYRYVNNKENCVWSMDFTKINTEIVGKEGYSHYLLVIVDHFARYIIYLKVFFFGKEKGCVTGAKVVKAVEYCLATRDVTSDCIIHTDNGAEFTNSKYFNFIKKHPFLQGSTSEPHKPKQNAVSESLFNTLKNKMYLPIDGRLPPAIPKVIKTTQMCDTLMEQRCHYYNKYLKTVKNGKLSELNVLMVYVCNAD